MCTPTQLLVSNYCSLTERFLFFHTTFAFKNLFDNVVAYKTNQDRHTNGQEMNSDWFL